MESKATKELTDDFPLIYLHSELEAVLETSSGRTESLHHLVLKFDGGTCTSNPTRHLLVATVPGPLSLLAAMGCLEQLELEKWILRTAPP